MVLNHRFKCQFSKCSRVNEILWQKMLQQDSSAICLRGEHVRSHEVLLYVLLFVPRLLAQHSANSRIYMQILHERFPEEPENVFVAGYPSLD